jgi:predicted Zn-dependent peptidase
MSIRLLLTVTLCVVTPALSSGQDLVTLQQRVLDNGVTVIVWERPSAGRVGTRMFYRVDVAAERPGTVGLTHMLEHFLFKGSDLAGTTDWEAEKAIAERIEVLERQITDEKNRNRDCFRQRDVFADVERDCQTPRLKTLQAELDRAVDAQDRLSDPTWYDWAVQGAGGTNSTASTGADWMKFDIDLPASKLELFMWTERARVERPVFRQFEAEREVVVNQIRSGDNRPDGKFERMLQSMTYEASPYGWAHWFSDLTRATREDHWEIFHKYFIPQNAIIVVVGEVKADEVFRMAEAYWGSWQPGRPSPRLRTVEPPPVGERRLTVSAAAGPRLAVNVPMPAAGHPDLPAFQVLGEVLSGEDGRLAKEIVTARKIATSARASGSPSKYRSHFGIRVDVRGNDDLPAVEEGVETVLRRVRNAEVTQAELDAAAGRLVLGMARDLEEIGNAAVTIGAMESIHHAGYLNELPRLWRSVTKEDLARIVGTYFTPEMRTVGLLRREAKAPATSAATRAEGGAVAAPAAAAGATGARENRRAMSMPALNDGARDGEVAQARDLSVPPREQQPEPLAIAEQPWNAPPWLAPRRPSGFASPAPTLRHTELRFPDAPFTPPAPGSFLHQLPNGLRSFIVAEAVLPMAQVTVLVDAPATNDPPGKEGLASLVAGILQRTGTSTHSREQFEQALARLNATLTVGADQNGTRLHLVSPPEAVKEALALVGALITMPDLASVFEAERERAAVAAGRAGDAPAFQARLLFDQALYGPDHPAARRPTAASVRAIALEDARQLHQSRYRADRVALAISGGVERGAVEAAVASAFGGMPARGPAPAPDGIVEPGGRTRAEALGAPGRDQGSRHPAGPRPHRPRRDRRGSRRSCRAGGDELRPVGRWVRVADDEAAAHRHGHHVRAVRIGGARPWHGESLPVAVHRRAGDDRARRAAGARADRGDARGGGHGGGVRGRAHGLHRRAGARLVRDGAPGGDAAGNQGALRPVRLPVAAVSQLLRRRPSPVGGASDAHARRRQPRRAEVPRPRQHRHRGGRAFGCGWQCLLIIAAIFTQVSPPRHSSSARTPRGTSGFRATSCGRRRGCRRGGRSRAG